jgi:16S rRNA (cytosine1402-N4)-methyltransferase
MPAPNRRHEYHDSVLLAETVALLAPAAGKTFVDGTLGGGGHSAALLEAGARVIGLDRDPEAIAYATQRLAGYGDRFQTVRTSFAEAGAALDKLGFASRLPACCSISAFPRIRSIPRSAASASCTTGRSICGWIPAGPITAADLVNTMSAEQLERIFRTYGEEPAARRIAAALVRDRLVQPFTTTLQLADAISKVSPRRGKAHPATRVFQALRIAVNRELEVLESALNEFAARLEPGGRFTVITFHSLEDRLVKTHFKNHSTAWLNRPEWPEQRRNPDCIFQKVTGKAVAPSATEQRANPRSRSAKLRVVEKL